MFDVTFREANKFVLHDRTGSCDCYTLGSYWDVLGFRSSVRILVILTEVFMIFLSPFSKGHNRAGILSRSLLSKFLYHRPSVAMSCDAARSA
jgi:hypothetical protein